MKLNQKQRNLVLCLHLLIAAKWESMAGGTVHSLKTTALQLSLTKWTGKIRLQRLEMHLVHDSLLAPTLFLPLCSPPVPSLFFRPLFFFLPTMSYGHTDEQTSINIKTKTWNIKPDREHHHKQEKNEEKKWWRTKFKEKTDS